jgi:hypothetical protein
MLVDRLLGRFAAEELGEVSNGAPIRDPGRDVRPLPRVRTLREETAELVERRLCAQDAVRMVVDELDRVQYFKKWPCCSNCSSPSE